MSWLDFVRDFKIPYKSGSGKNNIQIHCAQCGKNDTSGHLGLNLGDPNPRRNNSYGCWEDSSHSGKDPARLIKWILKVSEEEASAIARRYFKNFRPEKYEPREKSIYDPIKKPEEFMSFGFDEKLERPFINYLKTRGFDPYYTIKRFNLHWCISGQYAYRLIIPIIFKGQWYTWTARSIDPNTKIRYLAANEKHAPLKPSTFLYDQENLTGGDLLIVTEGPFNTMKIVSAFVPAVDSSSIFGKLLTDHQQRFLLQISSLYKIVAISLDPDAMKDTRSMVKRLSCYMDNVRLLQCPSQEDWAAMSIKEIKDFLCQKLGR